MNSYTGSSLNKSLMEETGGADEVVQKVTKLFAQQNIHVVPSDRLKQISPKDRENSLYEVHGVSGLVKETPEFVQETLTRLKLELDTTSSDTETSDSAVSRQGYDLAVQQSPDFVESQLLCFLRAESFDVSKAASRCLQHYQAKLHYFGFERLGKALGLSDLDEIDMQALKAGAVQVLKVKDRSGRAIIAQFPIVTRLYRVSVVVSYKVEPSAADLS
jgi:hypothetical protein